MGKVILPKTYVEYFVNPVIFLAGPILGAPNWQDEAIKIIFSINTDLTIVSPRRGIREEIADYITKGNESYFKRQREWERHYLDEIYHNRIKGLVMFWMPGEEEHSCKKVYGATTRLEIGQAMTNYKHLGRNVRFCI